MPRLAAGSVLPVAAALALLLPGVAAADQGAAVIQDCLDHSRITGHYSQKAYNEALAELPADVSEYSDCPNLIRQARLAAAAGRAAGGGGSGRGGAGGGGGGASAAGAGPAAASFSATERRAVADASRRGGEALNLAGQVVRPGVVHANVASAVNSLPTPLLALLCALAAGALVSVGGAIRNRVRARRPH